MVGSGYLPYVLDMDEWLELTALTGVPVYPSFNTNTLEEWRTVLSGPTYHEALRAICSYYWSENADGQYLFNHFCQRNWHHVERGGTIDLEYIFAPLNELGDPVELRGKDKLYAIQPHYEQCMHQQALGPSHLPIPVHSMERSLPLRIGPDGDSLDGSARVRAYITGGSDDTRVWLRLNHMLLEARRNGQWVEADVPRGVLRSGANVLGVWSDQRRMEAANPVILHRVFVPISYRSNG